MFADGLVDLAALAALADGLDWLAAQCASFPPERTEEHTGVAPGELRALARELVETPRAAVYGRLGTCVVAHGSAGTGRTRRTLAERAVRAKIKRNLALTARSAMCRCGCADSRHGVTVHRQ
jgi:anaerobic selenocysteine-containing dehydrogenase